MLRTSPEELVFVPKPGILLLSQRESPSKGFYFFDRGPLILISGEATNPSILEEKKVRYSVLTDDFC